MATKPIEPALVNLVRQYLFPNITDDQSIAHVLISFDGKTHTWSQLKDLLSKLLCKEPNKRIGLKSKKEIKTHPWFQNINWDDVLTKNIKPSIDFSLIKNKSDNSNK